MEEEKEMQDLEKNLEEPGDASGPRNGKGPMPVPVLFTLDEAERAGDDWNFNCGPAALCAVLGFTPDEIRPHMLDFESKGYTNPTLMFDVLKRLNVAHYQCYRSDNPTGLVPRVPLGLLRVQWGGPWTKPGVPMRVRYRQTHWAGMCGGWMFDVNAMCPGGWLRFAEWAGELIPWLIRECVPKGDGTWWPTHVITVNGGDCRTWERRTACTSR